MFRRSWGSNPTGVRDFFLFFRVGPSFAQKVSFWDIYTVFHLAKFKPVYIFLDSLP